MSEEIIAKAIKKYDILRHKLLILSKCFALVKEWDLKVEGDEKQDRNYVNQSGRRISGGLRITSMLTSIGFSRQAIFAQVEGSLKRLDTPYLDLLQIHRFDKTVPIEETMEALHDLVKSGKVRYIGASSMFAYQFAMMQFCAEKNGWTKFVSMQNQYSLLYREEEREMNAYCDVTGVGLIPVCRLRRNCLF